MTIALARARKFSGPRYGIVGELSVYSDWIQTLEIPSADNTVSISGQSVKITFRESEWTTGSTLTIASTASQITITDADTLSISVTDDVMSALTLDEYHVDITSSSTGVITHWAHGIVPVRRDPVTF